MTTPTVMIDPIRASALPGLFGIKADVGPNQRAALFKNGAAQALAPGQRHAIASFGDVFFNRVEDIWLAAMPGEPVSLAVSVRANANDGLADVLLLFSVSVEDPLRFGMWAYQGSERSEHLEIFTTDDLRAAVTDVIEMPVNAVLHRYLSQDLASEQARGEVWRAVRGALLLPSKEWGLKIEPAAGAGMAIEPARAVVARAERMAELQKQLDEVAQNSRVSQAARDAETEAIIRDLRLDYGEQVAEAVSEAAAPPQAPASPETSAPVAAPSRQPSALRAVLAEVKAAADARAARELHRRADTIKQSLEKDVAAPVPAAIPPAPQIASRGVDWNRVFQIAKLALAAVTLGFTLYFGYQQVSSLVNDTGRQFNYLKELLASLMGFLGSLAGLQGIQNQLRRKNAQAQDEAAAVEEAIPQVWTMDERSDYDWRLRSQVMWQLEEIVKSLNNARAAMGRNSLFEEAARVNMCVAQAKTLAQDIHAGKVGNSAYLSADEIPADVFEAMLAADEQALAASRHAVDTAEELNRISGSAKEMDVPAQRMRAALIDLQGAMNRRSDFLPRR